MNQNIDKILYQHLCHHCIVLLLSNVFSAEFEKFQKFEEDSPIGIQIEAHATERDLDINM